MTRVVAVTHLGVNAVVADAIRVDGRGASGGRWDAPPAFEDLVIDLLRSAAVTQESLEPNTLARFVRTARSILTNSQSGR
jgi:hypothetical protein